MYTEAFLKLTQLFPKSLKKYFRPDETYNDIKLIAILTA